MCYLARSTDSKMRFQEIYRRDCPVFSFELYPPKTSESYESLQERLPKLVSLKPDFMTVTYGAMGSTQELTLEIASQIRKEFEMETAHHLTCVGCNSSEIEERLGRIRDCGIDNIVALRGDPPKGESEFRAPEHGYSHAIGLVKHIRRFGGFGVAVAGYPEKHLEATSYQEDLQFLREKVEAGADVVITQLFYDNNFFFDFVERCRAIDISVPIVPGLLPIMSINQIRRITSMCGSSIPDGLMKALERHEGDPGAIGQVGIEQAIRQSIELLEAGVPGIHFYVLNRFFQMDSIMRAIRPDATRSKGADC